jgi:hypothetical protein
VSVLRWMRMASLLLSMRDAVFTVSPNRLQRGHRGVSVSIAARQESEHDRGVSLTNNAASSGL